MIIGFVYNGDEGSRVALPMVMETMEAYFRLVGRPGAPAAPIFGSIPEPTVAAPPAPGN
jgi:hypothetical protein